ncbi:MULTISPECIES: hypothetical protein [unclassified Streptomyces]|uniref:hypothetical protein n=1 Tax=unclassified Streptomyces TaxID=2593676 RepID=UPI002E823F5B|nr:hypothetical protein [Streptomyces sp. NBC_00589]WTI35938.1 hypothetical protein OIC96_13495 [Streptomyces sp. NBC_00775]WUB30388.1 hypothetical protein OHA51_36235 [Streptomyces sp. NBC_00589]
MLALRLARGAQPLVQVRRLLVAAASAGTGFLLLCTLGYAIAHPDASAASVLRLAWCVVPLAATVYFAVAVARTDPGTRPRPGLSAIGLGPGRLMAVAAVTTALSTTLGSLLALLFFLHLRGDLTGMPFDGAAAEFLAADEPLPLPAALTLLTLVPVAASVAAALVLRPHGGKPQGGTRSYGRTWIAARQSVLGNAAGRGTRRGGRHAGGGRGTSTVVGTAAAAGTANAAEASADAGPPTGHDLPVPQEDTAAHDGPDFHWTAEEYASEDARRGVREPSGARADVVDHDHSGLPAPYDGFESLNGSAHTGEPMPEPTPELDPSRLPPPESTPGGLPWGAAALAAGLAVETYASRSAAAAPGLELPGGFVGGPAGVLVGWVLTAVGLALAGPAITYLCGRLLQAVRPGALRLLAGRVLQAESRRIGQPLGVVCAVASGGYAMATLYTGARPDFGPLTTLGALLVAGCTLLTLATAAVEAKQARADTTAALLRLGAPSTLLRGAAALRVGALLALFAPLTWAVAELAALPLGR